MASVQVVSNQGDPLDNNTDTKPKEQDEILKICEFAIHHCIRSILAYFRE